MPTPAFPPPAHASHFFATMPSGGVQSIFFAPTSLQLVDRTVPLLSTNDFIIALRVSSSPCNAGVTHNKATLSGQKGV